MLEFVDGRFQFLAIAAAGGNVVKPYPLVEDLVRRALRVGMPRTLRTEADSDSDRDRESEEARESWQQAEGRMNSELRADRRGRPRIETMSPQNHEIRPEMVCGTFLTARPLG